MTKKDKAQLTRPETDRETPKDLCEEESLSGIQNCAISGSNIYVYIDATSRPLRQRVKEHLQNLEYGKPNSFIICHRMECHRNSSELPKFSWKVRDRYPDSLRRQLCEGLFIIERGGLNKRVAKCPIL